MGFTHIFVTGDSLRVFDKIWSRTYVFLQIYSYFSVVLVSKCTIPLPGTGTVQSNYFRLALNCDLHML